MSSAPRLKNPKNSERMGVEPVGKLLFTYSAPVYVAYVAGAIYNLISRALISNSPSMIASGELVTKLAAISVCLPVTTIQMAFASLFGMGGSTLAAIKVGEGDKEGANVCMNRAFQMIVVFGLAYIAFGYAFLPQILRAFGASEKVLPDAMQYGKILLLGSVFQMLAIGMTNYMRVEGRTGLAMISVFIGPVFNVIFGYLLIKFLDMGIVGAAWATIIGQFSCAAVIVIHYLNPKAYFRFGKSMFGFSGALALQIMYTGVSSFTVSLCNSIVSIFLNRTAKKYGSDVAIAGLGVVTTLQHFIVTPAQAVHMGWQSIIGYNFGARLFDRIRRTVRTGIIACVVILTAEWIVMQLFAHALVTPFCKSSPELEDFAARALRIYLVMLPIIPLQQLGSGFFQAIRRPLHAVVLSLTRQFIILIPALAILPKFFGMDGVLFAQPTADLLSVIITLPFMIYFYRNLEKVRATVRIGE